MRACDGCTKCCQGYLSGTINGHEMGNLKPCAFMDKVCTIYEDRPPTCSNYFCAWAQEVLPLWMKPDQINTIVSVEIDAQGKQFLKAVSPDKITADVHVELDTFTKNNNTYYTTVRVIKIKGA